MVGTTSEIRASSSLDNDNEIVLRAKGRHRFVLLQKPRKLRGVYVAQVLILNETLPVLAQYTIHSLQ